MAVDTNKLAALVEEQNQNPLASMPEVAGDEGEADMPEEEAAGADGEALLEEMGEFGVLLKENADVIIPIAEEIGEDLAGDSEYAPETEEAVADAVDRMPEELAAGMAENLAELPLEELNAIGEVLVAEVETEATPAGEADPMEAEQVGGLLEVAAAASEAPMEEDMEDEEEEDMDMEEEAPMPEDEELL